MVNRRLPLSAELVLELAYAQTGLQTDETENERLPNTTKYPNTPKYPNAQIPDECCVPRTLDTHSKTDDSATGGEPLNRRRGAAIRATQTSNQSSIQPTNRAKDRTRN